MPETQNWSDLVLWLAAIRPANRTGDIGNMLAGREADEIVVVERRAVGHELLSRFKKRPRFQLALLWVSSYMSRCLRIGRSRGSALKIRVGLGVYSASAEFLSRSRSSTTSTVHHHAPACWLLPFLFGGRSFPDFILSC